MVDKGKRLLAMAEELDGMDRDVPSKTAEFLEEVLTTLRAGERLDPGDEDRLERLHEKYFGEQEDADEDEKRGDEEDDPDPDDFV